MALGAFGGVAGCEVGGRACGCGGRRSGGWRRRAARAAGGVGRRRWPQVEDGGGARCLLRLDPSSWCGQAARGGGSGPVWSLRWAWAAAWWPHGACSGQRCGDGWSQVWRPFVRRWPVWMPQLVVFGFGYGRSDDPRIAGRVAGPFQMQIQAGSRGWALGVTFGRGGGCDRWLRCGRAIRHRQGCRALTWSAPASPLLQPGGSPIGLVIPVAGGSVGGRSKPVGSSLAA